MLIKRRWRTAKIQLTDWHIAGQPLVLPLGQLDIFPANSHFRLDVLREFLLDTERAGKYAVNADTYARASLSCLKYLCRCPLATPISLHFTRRNLSWRRNKPWHWRRYKKLLSGMYILKDFQHNSHFVWKLRFSQNGYIVTKPFASYYRQLMMKQMYMDATYIGMKFLHRALPLSAKSDELITFASAEKSFSQRTLQFKPAEVKKCKAAIATYLSRVQQQSGAMSNENSV